MKKRPLALVLVLTLCLLSACGGGGDAAASTMRLRRTEGTVRVSDEKGADLEAREDLSLYSGYGLGTKDESHAWVELDRVKLTKLDQNSEAAITKDGKKLEIEVVSGALFFNVTEPLADDETMTIRVSTMAVGIRGTCGWAALSPDGDTLTVGLLEGKVECSNGESTAAVSAGEKGSIPASGEITVTPLSAAQVPAFVKAELEEDSALAEAVKDASGMDVLAPVDPIRLRDMYTYSRSLNYLADGRLVVETAFFPDEMGRIGRVTQDGNETVCEYIYSDEGSLLQTVRTDGTIMLTVTEDTADHRTMISPEHPNRTYTYYYDEQGRMVSAEYNGDTSYQHARYVYTYDAEGRLTRTDQYDSDDQLISYSLYEYD